MGLGWFPVASLVIIHLVLGRTEGLERLRCRDRGKGTYTYLPYLLFIERARGICFACYAWLGLMGHDSRLVRMTVRALARCIVLYIGHWEES